MNIIYFKTVSSITQLFGETKFKKKKKKSIILLSREKAPTKDKNAFVIERIPYCKCILATLLQNRGQYLKIFVLSKVLNFILLVPQWSDLLWTCKLVTRRQIPCPNYFIIIMYYEVFLYFFPNQFFQKIVFFLRSFVRQSGGI